MIRLLIFIILLPTITIAGDHPKTCAAQLDTYRNCLTANANHCSPLCAGVHVVLNPQVLATMTEAGQTVACDAMKLMSCSYQSWCCENREGQKTACVTEEQSYWQCIEQEAGCGPIDCEAVLEPSEPQEPEETEETEPPVIPPDTDPEEDDEEETKPPRPSNDTPRTCAAELKTYQKCVVSNPSKCRAACRDVDVILNPNLLATMENPARACYALNLKSCKFQEWCCKSPEGVATACENEQNAYWQCIEQEAGCGAFTCEIEIPPPDDDGTAPPIEPEPEPTQPVDENDGEDPLTPQDDEEDEETNNPNNRPRTCAAQLDTYRNCLTANANHCSPLCAGVHVVLNPQVLATMTEAGQTVACDAMKLMSCSYQSWCCENREGQKTACVTEEQSYWQCIEQEAGCGPIDCEAVLEPSEPQEPEETEETEPPVIPPDTDPEEDDEEETKPPRPSNDTPRTCAAELKTYQKCVVSNPSKCRAACRDVDVILNPNLLATMENPARACYALNLKSCKFQEWCCKSPEGVATACENEQNAYWQCIEQEAGCGALTCETASGSTSEVATSTSVTARATKRPRTCPTQLQAYQQCVFANPKYCFPSCAKVDVIINPRMLAEMLSPTRACAAMKTMSCGYQLSACCKNHKGVEVACGAQKRAYWRCIEQKAGCGAIDCKKLNLPRISTSSTPMATMIEKTKLRKKSARVPQKETCKAELETMQECEVAKNCSRDCGETVVEDNSYEPILNLCWMQGCCERCETEQTGYLQCLERQTECSLDCRMNLDELEESEEYEAAGDAAPSLARSFQGVFTLCLAAFVLLQ